MVVAWNWNQYSLTDIRPRSRRVLATIDWPDGSYEECKEAGV
jgi:hypothetical protein